MNKRGIRLLTILLGVFTLLSTAVYAENAFTNMMKMVGKFIFEDFASMGEWGFKFLLWLVLFAITDYGLKKGDFDAKTSGIIAFVLATGTMILIPGAAIVKIFQLYSFLVIVSLGVLVPLILFWVIHKNFQGDDEGHMFIRAVLYGMMGFAMWWFAGSAKVLLGGFPG